jgi:hypothetical protein
MPGSASHSPGRRVGWQCKRGPTIQPPPPQASGVQQRESGPEGVGAKDESNGSWEDQAEGKGRRRKAIWIESDCVRSNVAD